MGMYSRRQLIEIRSVLEDLLIALGYLQQQLTPSVPLDTWIVREIQKQDDAQMQHQTATWNAKVEFYREQFINEIYQIVVGNDKEQAQEYLDYLNSQSFSQLRDIRLDRLSVRDQLMTELSGEYFIYFIDYLP